MDLTPAERLIVALDLLPTEALDLVRALSPQVRWFKLRGHGRDLVRHVHENGGMVMLDLKLYDTRDSVQGDMEEISKLGIHYVTVHADCVQYAL